jgi:flagella basal body P-ring formation protein FlgA
MDRPTRLFAALLACAFGPSAAYATERVTLASRDITIADLASLTAKQEERFGSLVVASLPAGNDHLDLNAAKRETLLRRRVPGHVFHLKSPDAVRFEFSAAQQRPRPPRICFALSQALAAGSYVEAADITQAECHEWMPRLPMRFDRQVNMVRLSAPLPAGTYLGRVSSRHRSIIQADQELVLAARNGPVTIERSVRSLQPARRGDAIFVRTHDGAILSAQTDRDMEDAR